PISFCGLTLKVEVAKIQLKIYIFGKHSNINKTHTKMIKFALIKERETPPDRRVVFSPEKLKEVVQMFPEASFKIESSDVRIFSDEEYRKAGFEVSDDISNCEIMLGVKEVPLPFLIPDKKYFFFSHTIKKQPYNRDLLREILNKNIELYDHEVIVAENGHRLIGFEIGRAHV